MKPLAYDVFCGGGGATKGYQNAGFYVVGVDIKPQKNYCGDEFIQMDALVFLGKLLVGEYPEPLFIHASPPCQKYSQTKNLKTSTKNHPDLVEPTRKALLATGKPYIIENVPGAPLINPLMLCGTMFGLRVIRHRLFECSTPLWWPPTLCQHEGLVLPMWWKSQRAARLSGKNYPYITVAGKSFLMPEARRAMGIDWMVRDELSQAIPPAYTKWIGERLLEAVAQ